MNPNPDNSDEIQPKHTILITDGNQSPLAASSPTSTGSDINDQNEGEHTPDTPGSSQESSEDDPDAHQPDDAGPQPGDRFEIRGRSDPLLMPGEAPKPPVSSNTDEGKSRGLNVCVAQARRPVSAGPSPIIGDQLLPTRAATSPPPAPPANFD